MKRCCKGFERLRMTVEAESSILFTTFSKVKGVCVTDFKFRIHTIYTSMLPTIYIKASLVFSSLMDLRVIVVVCVGLDSALRLRFESGTDIIKKQWDGDE